MGTLPSPKPLFDCNELFREKLIFHPSADFPSKTILEMPAPILGHWYKATVAEPIYG